MTHHRSWFYSDSFDESRLSNNFLFCHLLFDWFNQMNLFPYYNWWLIFRHHLNLLHIYVHYIPLVGGFAIFFGCLSFLILGATTYMASRGWMMCSFMTWGITRRDHKWLIERTISSFSSYTSILFITKLATQLLLPANPTHDWTEGLFVIGFDLQEDRLSIDDALQHPYFRSPPNSERMSS